MPKVTVITSLYNCREFVNQYLEYALHTTHLDKVEFLLLHNQPSVEENALIEPFLKKFPHLTYVTIPNRESLYMTWNRGIFLAKGDYLTIWNVDDIRTPESIWLQAHALDNQPAAMLSYGDFYGTNQYKMQADRHYTYPHWSSNNKEFLRRHMIGCFPMWRKEVHKYVGYFDENYSLVADYEFQLRVALNFPLVKAVGNLGYYLENQPHKLSSQQNTQHLERTSVEWRYNIFTTLDLSLLKAAKTRYDSEHVINFGKKILIKTLIPHYNKHLKKQWLFAIICPLYTAKQMSKRGIKKFLGINALSEWPVYQWLNRLTYNT